MPPERPRRSRATLGRFLLLTLAGATAAPSAAADAAGCADEPSQAAITECAGASFEEADAALRATLQEVVGRLRGNAAAGRRLRDAQRAWVEFRDTECAFVATRAEGASIHPLVLAECLASLTRSRTEHLARLLDCPEGDAGCPLPPAP